MEKHHDFDQKERKIKLLEEELLNARNEASKAVDEIGILQNRLREATSLNNNNKDLLKAEVGLFDLTSIIPIVGICRNVNDGFKFFFIALTKANKLFSLKSSIILQ